ncbi:MAG: hypothetical protein NWF01_05710 [Candidatus Bathyarchaeota archaeon]|nr:hypothetical protein [Candidatus Bathyarchaeota archaeon]
MAQIFGGTTEIVIVIVIVIVAVGVRLYLMRTPGLMRARCPKCGIVFDASRTFSGVHILHLRNLTCPACGKTSFMNSYVKDPITWPATETKQPQTSTISEEELEEKRIEDSKYEKA